MNKLQPLKILVKNMPKNINPNTLGYVHPTGEISFANKESALKYAKNRVVSALNYENGKQPFERGFIIHDNAILAQSDGNSRSVTMQLSEKYRHLEVITVHGHPDQTISLIEQFVRKIKNSVLSLFGKSEPSPSHKTNGIALPVSFPDYCTLILSPNEKQAIVYNSKGQFSKLTKLPEANNIGYSELKEIENEYTMNIDTGYLYQLKQALKSIKRAFMSPQKSEETAKKYAQKRQAEIHDFWVTNDENLCKVKYETDFGIANKS